jgi:hypothetical protein
MRKYIAGIAAAAALMATSAKADTINWTQWTLNGSASSTASGSIAGGITVSYTGEAESVNTIPFWTPATSWQGGTIGNAPLQGEGAIQLFGGPTYGKTDTITFSTALINPVIAIWSLGAGGTPAVFDFGAQPFSIQAGGPNNPYGGQTITLDGTPGEVAGVEGNGVIQFQGAITSITFTTPTFENWYGFTVGNDISAAVPEPATWAMFLLGFGAIGWTLRSRRTASPATA